MNNQKVQNPKTETPKTIELNDKDMITDLLATEKNMNVNFAVALNEASNEILCQKLWNAQIKFEMLKGVFMNYRLRKGWYTLEKAETQKSQKHIPNIKLV